jgi:aminoglycoside phosphotransferase (APT) family kinase protein
MFVSMKKNYPKRSSTSSRAGAYPGRRPPGGPQRRRGRRCTVPKMHADEIDTDVPLVRRLLAAQFPQWAALPLEPVSSAGTVNAIYRLGEDMAVRLPRVPWAFGGVEKEQRWLPKLAPHLPLAVPVPLAQGAPGDDFPWPWSVLRWLEGETWSIDRVGDLCAAAAALAQFVTALRGIDAADGPSPARAERGSPLADRDALVREAIAALEGEVDTGAVSAAWQVALEAPAWDGPPVWFHGDLLPVNLLVVAGRLSAVIDFEVMGVGDPSCDLMPAWMLFSGESRDVFRTTLSVDEASWARGRGWALSVALIALPYYRETNPAFANHARYVIGEVLADHSLGG